jgi:hypothetical protein
MICWIVLIARALNHHLARRAHQHSRQRIQALLQLRRQIDTELLQALRAEDVAEQRMKTLGAS